MSGNHRRVALAFGQVLRTARRERGVSQDELSERCGFDRTYPSLLERGLRQLTLGMIFRLSDGLRIEADWFVRETVRWLEAVSHER
jgi:transcriptional regulator with XRE-family HTH domain